MPSRVGGVFQNVGEMSITDYLVLKGGLAKQPELTNENYSMFNTGGPECEVGEFLYGLVRMMKPDNVLETGTHFGISASYIGCALRDNGRGILTTIEFDPQFKQRATVLFKMLEIEDYVDRIHKLVEEVQLSEDYSCDIMFLDTEPHLRFGEFMGFWKYLNPGGVGIIHDLHPGMGQTGKITAGMLNWPFGTIPEEIEKLIRDGKLQSFHFPAARGLYIGQKEKEGFYSSEILASNLIQPKGER